MITVLRKRWSGLCEYSIIYVFTIWIINTKEQNYSATVRVESCMIILPVPILRLNTKVKSCRGSSAPDSMTSIWNTSDRHDVVTPYSQLVKYISAKVHKITSWGTDRGQEKVEINSNLQRKCYFAFKNFWNTSNYFNVTSHNHPTPNQQLN